MFRTTDSSSLATATIYAVSYDGARAEPFGVPRPLFTVRASDFAGRSYTVGMGGRRFVFKRNVPDRPTRELRVVTGWHALLSRGAVR